MNLEDNGKMTIIIVLGVLTCYIDGVNLKWSSLVSFFWS